MDSQRQHVIFGHLRTPAAILLMALGLAAAPAAQETDPEATPAAPSDSEAQAPAVTPPAARPPPEQAQRDMQLLAAKLPPASVQWLEAGGERFLAVYEADYTGAPQGAILMLHAEGQHPAAHATMEAIRQQLPQHGWATLAAVLPSPGTPSIPPRPARREVPADTETAPGTAAPGESEEIFDETTGEVTDGRDPAPDQAAPGAEPRAEPGAETEAEPDSEPAIRPVEERVTERLQVALQFLQDQGIFNVVILGHGVGAARAAEFYRLLHSAAPAAPIQALLFINARNNIPLTATDLPQCLTDPALPVLDIYYGSDPRDLREAQHRRRQAKRRQLSKFIQLRLPAQSTSPNQHHNQLMRRIRGFLEKHAAGMEIGK